MKKTQILLIEDDDGDAMLVRRALRGSSILHELTWVTSLVDALDHLHEHSVSIILTDLGLPDCSGIDAVAKLRAATKDTTIIVLSGLENSATQLQALDQGAQDYMIKPEISTFTLERAIEHGTHRLKNERKVRRLLDAVNNQKLELQRQAKLLDKKNRRLRRLCKTAQQCINNVSHDFRTPLTVVKEYASLIADGVVGDVQPEQIRMLQVIGDRVDDLNNMVDDMLDVSRQNSGLLCANRLACHADTLLSRLITGLHQKALLRGITLQVKIDEDLPGVFCDPEKVGRVVMNLITNAIKFTQPGGTVIVRAEACQANNEVRISVSDDGPGISPDDCQLIFKRFEQVKNGLQNTAKGFGLGLSIAKELVALNLGTISLQSVLGEGSTFSFTIPVNDPIVVSRLYIQRLNAISRNRAHVSLLMGKCDAPTAKEEREVGDFLVGIHHSRDLVFDLGEGKWLLLVCANRNRVDQVIGRAQRERDSVNRNRPSGPLPAIEFEHIGSFHTKTAGDSLLDAIGAIACRSEAENV
ncbi:MAG: hybrid sensor histidine kinase/response regulator [Pirellulaceae bacterium]|nr:hybrid sensor histidine kinase/response regulator [Pirellulaceae bacterium]